MELHVDVLQELPAQESAELGAQGCCALWSIMTCQDCTFLKSN